MKRLCVHGVAWVYLCWNVDWLQSLTVQLQWLENAKNHRNTSRSQNTGPVDSSTPVLYFFLPIPTVKSWYGRKESLNVMRNCAVLHRIDDVFTIRSKVPESKLSPLKKVFFFFDRFPTLIQPWHICGGNVRSKWNTSKLWGTYLHFTSQTLGKYFERENMECDGDKAKYLILPPTLQGFINSTGIIASQYTLYV